MAALTPPHMDYCPDDTVCAYCNADLPVNPEPGSWAFEGGFCGAECTALYLVRLAEWPTSTSREEIVRAIGELGRASRRLEWLEQDPAIQLVMPEGSPP